MKLLLFSPPDIWPNETQLVTEMFERGLTDFHLRKPELEADELRDYIAAIPSEFHSRIILHYQFDLTKQFALKGLHFNEGNVGNSKKYAEFIGTKSYYARQHNDIICMKHKMDYFILGTKITKFNSTAPNCPFSNTLLERLMAKKNNLNLVAAGGIRSFHFQALQQMGFWGAAILSEIWNTKLSDEKKVKKLEEMLESLLEQTRACGC